MSVVRQDACLQPICQGGGLATLQGAFPVLSSEELCLWVGPADKPVVCPQSFHWGCSSTDLQDAFPALYCEKLFLVGGMGSPDAYRATHALNGRALCLHCQFYSLAPVTESILVCVVSPSPSPGQESLWNGASLLGLLIHCQACGITLDGLWPRAYWRGQVHRRMQRWGVGHTVLARFA